MNLLNIRFGGDFAVTVMNIFVQCQHAFFFNVQYLLFAQEDSVLGSHLVLFLMPLLQDLREKYALNYVCTRNSEITENSNPLKEAKK